MKTKILLLAILLFAFKGYSQTWQWTHPEPNGSLDPNSERDEAHDVEVDSLGNVYVLGDFMDTLYLNNKFRTMGDGSYLAKYDSTGKLLWYKLIAPTYTNQDNLYNQSIRATDLTVTPQGVFIIGKYLPTTYQNAYDFDCTTGNHDGNQRSFSICGFNFTSAYNETGLFITKLNTNGGVVWNKLATGQVCFNNVYKLLEETDYSPLITNDKNNNLICEFLYRYNENPELTSLSIGSGNIALPPSSNDYSLIVFKLNNSGTLQWSNYGVNLNSLNSGGNDCRSIVVDNNNDVFLYGTAHDSCLFGSQVFHTAGYSATGDNNPSTFIAKISSSGTWQFAKELFNSNQNILDYGLGNPDYLTVDNSNNVYALVNLREYSYGSNYIITGDTVSANATNTYLIKLKNNGDLIWHKGFGSTDTYANSIHFSNSSLYISGGIRNHVSFGEPWYFSNLTVVPTSPYNESDIEYFVSKANMNGDFQWTTSFSGPNSYLNGFAVKAYHSNVYTAGIFRGGITTLGNLNSTFIDPNASTDNLFFGKLKNQYIKVGAVTPTALTAGCTITIPFTSYGLTFSNNNKFKAELSDINGDFTNPIVIGSTTSTGTGSITATIPTTLSYGSGYLVRIRSLDTLKTGYNYYAYADTDYRITLLCPAPSALTNTTITASSAKLNWHIVDCAKGYRLKYKVNTASTWTTINIITNTGSYNLTGLTTNTTYQWKVATKCKPGSTAYYSKDANTHTFTTTPAGSAMADINAKQLKTSALTVYPNPANDNAVIIFKTTKAEKYSLELTDISGKQLQKINGNAIAGENKIIINVGSFAQGMYLINLTDDEHEKRILKLNKQ